LVWLLGSVKGDGPQAEKMQPSTVNVNGIAMIMMMFLLMFLHATALALLLLAPQVPASLSAFPIHLQSLFSVDNVGILQRKIDPQSSQAQ
jgi:hypothetical protein